MDKEELKQRCLNVIEEHQDEIIALGKEAYKTPELGYKSWTASCATPTRMQLRAEWFMPAGIMCSWQTCTGQQ